MRFVRDAMHSKDHECLNQPYICPRIASSVLSTGAANVYLYISNSWLPRCVKEPARSVVMYASEPVRQTVSPRVLMLTVSGVVV